MAFTTDASRGMDLRAPSTRDKLWEQLLTLTRERQHRISFSEMQTFSDSSKEHASFSPNNYAFFWGSFGNAAMEAWQTVSAGRATGSDGSIREKKVAISGSAKNPAGRERAAISGSARSPARNAANRASRPRVAAGASGPNDGTAKGVGSNDAAKSAGPPNSLTDVLASIASPARKSPNARPGARVKRKYDTEMVLEYLRGLREQHGGLPNTGWLAEQHNAPSYGVLEERLGSRIYWDDILDGRRSVIDALYCTKIIKKHGGLNKLRARLACAWRAKSSSDSSIRRLEVGALAPDVVRGLKLTKLSGKGAPDYQVFSLQIDLAGLPRPLELRLGVQLRNPDGESASSHDSEGDATSCIYDPKRDLAGTLISEMIDNGQLT